jgi:heat-inducible transcriptional repressor
MTSEENLTRRQRDLLGVIVATHVKTGKPVGSGTLAKHCEGEVSSATIRNEMHLLEELDLVTQPHTSAGRAPTDKGYRYYVDHLMLEQNLAPHVASVVAREYRSECENIESLVSRTSRLLSDFSAQVGFVTFPDFGSLVLKRIELSWVKQGHLLVVLVAGNGFVQNRVIQTDQNIPMEDLQRISRFLNQALEGIFLDEVSQYLDRYVDEQGEGPKHLYRVARSIVLEFLPRELQRKISLEGSRHVFEQPEFRSAEKSKRLFRALEEREPLLDLIETDMNRDGVQVHIGLENECEDIQDCSFVVTRYRLNQRTVGGLGVIGPRRMPYGDIVSLVDFVSRRLGEALEQW